MTASLIIAEVLELEIKEVFENKFMKITKFAQSCILLETKNKRILVDPGYLHYEESLLRNGWDNLDAIFITHKHTDHCHEEAVAKMTQDGKTSLYSSREVAAAYPHLDIKPVREEDVVELDGIRV